MGKLYLSALMIVTMGLSLTACAPPERVPEPPSTATPTEKPQARSDFELQPRDATAEVALTEILAGPEAVVYGFYGANEAETLYRRVPRDGVEEMVWFNGAAEVAYEVPSNWVIQQPLAVSQGWFFQVSEEGQVEPHRPFYLWQNGEPEPVLVEVPFSDEYLGDPVSGALYGLRQDADRTCVVEIAEVGPGVNDGREIWCSEPGQTASRLYRSSKSTLSWQIDNGTVQSAWCDRQVLWSLATSQVIEMDSECVFDVGAAPDSVVLWWGRSPRIPDDLPNQSSRIQTLFAQVDGVLFSVGQADPSSVVFCGDYLYWTAPPDSATTLRRFSIAGRLEIVASELQVWSSLGCVGDSVVFYTTEQRSVAGVEERQDVIYRVSPQAA